MGLLQLWLLLLRLAVTRVEELRWPAAIPVLAAMKEELFALETDRLQGRLSEGEYSEQKAALEVVLRRALQRGERAVETSNIAGRVG